MGLIIENQKIYKAADIFAKFGLGSHSCEVVELLSECMDDKAVQVVVSSVEKYNPSEAYDILYEWFLEDVNKVLGQSVYSA